MLIKESKFLREIIQLLPNKKLKILNFGSQSLNYAKSKPYIYENIFKPLEASGHTIINLDIRPIDGADIVGDIFDDHFFLQLQKEQFDVIFVFNLLEHVNDLDLMIFRIQNLVAQGKHIIFSGPFKYPLHFDPIDNGFRPDVNQISMLFSKCNVVKGEIIKDYSYSKYLFSSPKNILFNIIRTLLFFYKFNKWWTVVIPKYKWLFKNYEITCVLFEKN